VRSSKITISHPSEIQNDRILSHFGLKRPTREMIEEKGKLSVLYNMKTRPAYAIQFHFKKLVYFSGPVT
jgi:hypothetical protein